jgi:hypothetical protein
MASVTTRQREREQRAGEAWVDAVKDTLDAQAVLYTAGLRYWRRSAVAVVETASRVAVAAAELANRSASERAEEVARGGRKLAESADDAATQPTRGTTRRARQRDGALPAEALEALTVEQLDRLATANRVEEYPQGGSKMEKADALSAARIDLEALTVEHLDRLAATNDVADYPQTGTKRDKISVLAASVPTTASQN